MCVTPVEIPSGKGNVVKEGSSTVVFRSTRRVWVIYHKEVTLKETGIHKSTLQDGHVCSFSRRSHLDSLVDNR